MRALALVVAVGECTAAPVEPPPEVDPLEAVMGPQSNSVCDLDWKEPPEPPPVTAVELVAAHGHGCVRMRSGIVRCWGANGAGELGLCAAEDQKVPQAFVGVAAARDVDVGRRGTCVVGNDGRVACSGGLRKFVGADGVGFIEGIEGAQAVAVGDMHVCVLRDAGPVVCFGDWSAADAVGTRTEVIGEGTDGGRAYGTLEVRGARQISAGASHSCALDGAGQVMCWGRNAQGQLGDPRAGEDLDAGQGAAHRVPGMPYIAVIDAAGDASCAASQDGEVFCWGVGFGPIAAQVPGPPAADVALGIGALCVASTRGEVACAGEGIGWLDPAGFEKIVDIAVGRGRICGRRSDGLVTCQVAGSGAAALPIAGVGL